MEILVLDNYISNCLKENKTPKFEEFMAVNENATEKDSYVEYMTEEIFELYVEYKTGNGVISLNEFSKIMSFDEFVTKMQEEDEDEGEEGSEGEDDEGSEGEEGEEGSEGEDDEGSEGEEGEEGSEEEDGEGSEGGEGEEGSEEEGSEGEGEKKDEEADENMAAKACKEKEEAAKKSLTEEIDKIDSFLESLGLTEDRIQELEQLNEGDEEGINDLVGSLTKSAATVAALGATAIGGTGFLLFTGIRNLIRAKNVKKMQLEIGKEIIAHEGEKINLGKVSAGIKELEKEKEAAKSPEEKDKLKQKIDKEKEDVKKARENQKKTDELFKEKINGQQEEVDKLVGTSKYLQRVKSKYKAESDKELYNLRIKNAEYLNLDDEAIADLKEKLKDAAKRAAELEQELTKETQDLQKKSEEEGGEEAVKKATPILQKIKSLDGKIINVKKEIEDLGGEIEKEAEAKKKEKEAEKKKESPKEGNEDDGVKNAVEKGMNTVKKFFNKKEESAHSSASGELNEGIKEKLQELQRTLWEHVRDRQKLVIDLLKETDKDGKNKDAIKSAEDKLGDIKQKVSEFSGGDSKETDTTDDEEIAAAEKKVRKAKEKLQRIEDSLESAKDVEKPDTKVIQSYEDKRESAIEELDAAEEELDALKKGKKTKPKNKAEETTKSSPAASDDGGDSKDEEKIQQAQDELDKHRNDVLNPLKDDLKKAEDADPKDEDKIAQIKSDIEKAEKHDKELENVLKKAKGEKVVSDESVDTSMYQTIDERIKNMRNVLANSEALKKLYNK